MFHIQKKIYYSGNIIQIDNVWKYGFIVMSVSDLAYHECGSDRILFETTNNFYEAQQNRIKGKRI
jgi:hypothetical protein